MSEENTIDSTEKHQAAETENKLIEIRREKLRKLQANKTAYRNDFKPQNMALDIIEQYAQGEKADLEAQSIKLSAAGRVIRSRGAFMVLQDMTGQIQLYINRKNLPSDQLDLIKSIDLGDILGAEGTLGKSNKGELYIDLTNCVLLTKSLRPLPDKHKGLVDTELCYRQRYVDLIVNQETRARFAGRSKLLSFTRDFFTQKRYIEVETPMLQAIPGGAAAKPFTTFHNALDLPMYLRIAPELYLKRLVVGGFDRVFEINRNFRNEGLSTRHNPEFTMLEFYQAYATYEDLIDMTQEYIRGAAQAVCGSLNVEYQGQAYDLTQEFTVLSMKNAIVQLCEGVHLDQLQTLDGVRNLASSYNIKWEESWGIGKVQTEIFEEKVEHQLIQPTFITEYPTEISPLARMNDEDSLITDRFEFFIGGRELANGFSELNDSEDQAARFKLQAANKDSGDDEAMHYDADYIHALEYGMPPTAGEGIGIDRLAMFLTDAASIRDVILFPHLKPK